MGETEQLAQFLSGLEFAQLPDDVVVMAQRAIKDAVGVGLFGSRMEWSRMVADFAAESSASGVATVWGADARLSAPYAALANGTAVHGIEMDDRHHNLQLHNGAATIPAALALGEERGSSGQDLVVAVVCGYEAAFRVARATKRTIDRFYWVSIRSIFGATAAAAKMLGLDAQGTQWAMGIAGSMASGLWEVKNDPRGTMVKRLQGGGWPANCGVTAALLAERGLSAPGTILEGEYGVCHAFSSRTPDTAAIARELGESFEMRHWETKPYAAWGGSHSTIDAALEAQATHGIKADDIDRIDVGCSQETYWHSAKERPESVMAAQTSLDFLVSAAFLYDLRDPSVWSDDIIRDETLEALRQRTTLYVDEELDRITREQQTYAGAKLTVRHKDGAEVPIWVRHAKGTPGNPMSEQDVDEKFRVLSRSVLDDDRLDRVGDAIARLPQNGTRVAELGGLLGLSS